MKIFKLSNIKFIFIYMIFIYVTSNILIYEKFLDWFTTKGVLDVGGLMAYLTIGLLLCIAVTTLLFSHKYMTKAFAIFILFASSFATYAIVKFGIAVDRSMILNIVNTNTSESLTLLSANIIPYVLFLAVIPSLLILKTEIVYVKPLKHLLKILLTFVLLFLISVGILYTKFDALHLAGNKSRKYMVYQLVPLNIINALGNTAKVYIEDNYISKAKPAVVDATLRKKEDLVVILAIGETSRQLNFSLYGYEKETNPLLSKQKDLHMLNGIAKYGSTIWAIPQILSKDNVKLPSVTKKAGIESSCFVNFKLYGNCGTVKEQKPSECGHGEKCYDEDVIPMLKKDLANYKEGQKLVVLHLGAGSHGPLYNTRYPKEFQKFNPQCLSADVMNNCTKEELYNSFDNTILYVDYVVSNLIDTLEASKVPYVFIYLSDHGESLLENDRVFHGMPPGVSLPYEQAHIPLLVKASVPIKIRKQDEYKQPDIYDTILDLLSVDTVILERDKVFIERVEK